MLYLPIALPKLRAIGCTSQTSRYKYVANDECSCGLESYPTCANDAHCQKANLYQW